MSSYYAAVYGTALIFKEKELFDVFFPRYKETALDTPTKKDAFANFLETGNFLDYAFAGTNDTNDFTINPLKTDECDGTVFTSLNKDTADLRSENIYVSWSAKPTTLIAHLNKTSYTSKEELLTEYKDKLSSYLPEDFDWESHIGEISCALYA